MKTFKILAVILSVAVIGVLSFPVSTNAAPAGKSINFKGNYSGTASLLFNGNSIKILTVQGNGSGSIVGAGSVTGIGSAQASGSSLCVPFKGTGAVKGAKGTIKFTVSTKAAQGCGNQTSGPVTVKVNGKAKVTGGTGSAKGAKGTLSFKGTLKLNDVKGSQSGSFTGQLSGKLTVK